MGNKCTTICQRGGEKNDEKKMITLIGVAELMASIVTMNTQSTSLGIVQHAEASSALNEGYDTGRNDYLNGNMKILTAIQTTQIPIQMLIVSNTKSAMKLDGGR